MACEAAVEGRMPWDWESLGVSRWIGELGGSRAELRAGRIRRAVRQAPIEIPPLLLCGSVSSLSPSRWNVLRGVSHTSRMQDHLSSPNGNSPHIRRAMHLPQSSYKTTSERAASVTLHRGLCDIAAWPRCQMRRVRGDKVLPRRGGPLSMCRDSQVVRARMVESQLAT